MAVLPRSAIGAVAVTAGLAFLATVLTMHQWAAVLPPADWPRAVWAPDRTAVPEMLIHEALLPRMVVAALAGAVLAVAGTILQHVLRNPLAEPGTLGVASGAYLAMAAASAWFPDLPIGRSLTALVGGLVEILAVLTLVGWQGPTPTRTVVAGLLMTQICAALSTAITLLHEQTSTGLLLWASGSLDGQDWRTATHLAIEAAGTIALLPLLLRPLALLGLDDGIALGLGLRAGHLRLAALALAVALSGFVVSAVGIIGFIGLASPAITRALGVRRFAGRLLCAPFIGGSLLWLTDAMVQAVQPEWGQISTGAASALLGVPLLLWLVPRTKHDLEPPTSWPSRSRRPGQVLLWCLVLLGFAAGLSVFVGRDASGWSLQNWISARPYLFWRVPRLVASLSAGSMLGLAGALLQRLTGNPMASPEFLGVSSGATLGLAAAVFILPSSMAAWQTVAAGAGAIAALVAVMVSSVRSSFAQSQVLMIGLALTTGTSALIGVLVGTGDSRAYLLLKWLSGTTDLATPATAGLTFAAGALALSASLASLRWLAIVPLGGEFSTAFGLALLPVRAAILLLAAVATGLTATIVGPLSFVGLLAPTISRLSGLTAPSAHVLGSALIGSLMMVLADWLSRVLLFPYPIPAGLLASLVAGPAITLLLRRQ